MVSLALLDVDLIVRGRLSPPHLLSTPSSSLLHLLSN